MPRSIKGLGQRIALPPSRIELPLWVLGACWLLSRTGLL